MFAKCLEMPVARLSSIIQLLMAPSPRHQGLTSLSLELAENFDYSDPFSDLMGKWSGQWKDTITSVIIAIGIMLTILVLFGCCLIPCLRALFLRAIESAVEK